MAKKSKANPNSILDEAELTELAMNLIDQFGMNEVATLLGHNHGKLPELRNRVKVLYLARQIQDEELLQVAGVAGNN